jgi:N-acetylglutamate synthase-like GNAT family acetyltransferase
MVTTFKDKNQNSYLIREYSIDEILKVEKIIKDCNKGYNLPIQKDDFYEKLINDTDKAFVIEKEDKDICAVSGYKVFKGSFFIDILYVQPSFQNKGLGKQNVSFLENIAKEEGFNEVYVIPDQKPSEFFKKIGYKSASATSLKKTLQ